QGAPLDFQAMAGNGSSMKSQPDSRPLEPALSVTVLDESAPLDIDYHQSGQAPSVMPVEVDLGPEPLPLGTAISSPDPRERQTGELASPDPGHSQSSPFSGFDKHGADDFEKTRSFEAPSAMQETHNAERMPEAAESYAQDMVLDFEKLES